MDGRLGVNCLAFTPDGAQLVAGGWGDEVPVWDVATGRRVRSFPSHANDTGRLALSKDGRLLATGGGPSSSANLRTGADHSVRIWDFRTGTLVAALPGHGQGVTGLAFTPDGKTLVTVDSAVRFWDVATGRQLRPQEAHEDWIQDMQFADDGTVVTAATDGTVRTWDARTGGQLRVDRIVPERLREVVLGPGGRRVGVVLHDGTAVVREVANGAEVGRYAVPGMHGTGRFTPSGAGLILRGHEAVTFAQFGGGTTTRKLSAAMRCLRAWDQDGRYAAEVRSTAPMPPGDPLGAHFFDTPKPPFDLVVWDVAAGAEYRRWRLPGAMGNESPYFAPDGRSVFVSGDQWELSTGLKRGSFKSWSPAGAFSPDGRFYAVGGNDRMQVWDVAGRADLFNQPLGVEASYLVRWSPDGRRIAASTGATVLVWELPAGPKPVALAAADVDRLWTELGGPDAGSAFRAVGELGSGGESAVAPLAARLRAAQAARLLNNPVTDPAQLRVLRGVEALEGVAGPAARRALADLAAGPADALATQEAGRACARQAP